MSSHVDNRMKHNLWAPSPTVPKTDGSTRNRKVTRHNNAILTWARMHRRRMTGSAQGDMNVVPNIVLTSIRSAHRETCSSCLTTGSRLVRDTPNYSKASACFYASSF